MSSNASAPNHQPCLKRWQRRALDRGRTPLPEKPGSHPWAANSAETSQDQISPGNAASASTLSTSDGTSQSASQPTSIATSYAYRFWSVAELERLIRLRRNGLSWIQIKNHFPDRSLESLKQTYHKRRGAVEAEMDANV
ncbi:hypothetical protein FVEN_g4523 [Fusarium venenatum]|uniref:Myb-like domain-containing protein n=1 Tax=Fusarium venenatum TaxID=56646 RepID=A0A2L2TR45_9HYPO|nr:uncharacterized protein FVRRES_02578 [Fusarium venenatum]KAG8357918.1 hypothetical protein FVEN_g4523 [Fusarium venenatum]KAH7004327.1 hypothetical protein EDB82DRAFT_471090 [Fusarium venenatum]CEI66066.1 unnamed protein product [Fusarium venenatum]